MLCESEMFVVDIPRYVPMRRLKGIMNRCAGPVRLREVVDHQIVNPHTQCMVNLNRLYCDLEEDAVALATMFT